MSATPPGPCQARIESIWDNAWKALGEGKPYQFFLAQAAAELAKFRDQIPAGDLAALSDFSRSEISDRSNRTHFDAHESRLDSERRLFASLRDFTMQNVQKAGFFVFQTLTYANGAVALATLGYMGRDGAGSVSFGMILVLILSSVGFLLTLLAGHVATLKSTPFIKLLAELATSSLADDVRAKKIGEIPGASREATLLPRNLCYAATGCLVLSLIIGAITLAHPASNSNSQIESHHGRA
jgi:hypothetical protein